MPAAVDDITAPPGYEVEWHLNQLAKRGCLYVKATAEVTGGKSVLIGWIGLVTQRGSAEGDGWSALSFCARDADTEPMADEWWRGRIVWGDQDYDAQAALDALIGAVDPAWLQALANRPDPAPVTRHTVAAAARRNERWYAPYRDELRGP